MTEQYDRDVLNALIDTQYEDGADGVRTIMNRWLARGDGAAVYQNSELGHPELGSIQVASFGSPSAQIEDTEPPQRMPDIGGAINWRYQLVGTYRGEAL